MVHAVRQGVDEAMRNTYMWGNIYCIKGDAFIPSQQDNIEHSSHPVACYMTVFLMYALSIVCCVSYGMMYVLWVPAGQCDVVSLRHAKTCLTVMALVLWTYLSLNIFATVSRIDTGFSSLGLPYTQHVHVSQILAGKDVTNILDFYYGVSLSHIFSVKILA